MASSGVRCSAQMPPATARTARMKIRKALRALAAMTRSMSVGAGGVGCMGLPGFEGTLHFRLGIDQEVGARHHPLTFLQAGSDSINVARLAGDLDVARFQFAAALVHENDVVLPAGRHGV